MAPLSALSKLAQLDSGTGLQREKVISECWNASTVKCLLELSQYSSANNYEVYTAYFSCIPNTAAMLAPVKLFSLQKASTDGTRPSPAALRAGSWGQNQFQDKHTL